MIVAKIKGGLGNQLFQYATGRALSLQLNTDLFFDLAFFENPKFYKLYRLDRFLLPVKTGKEYSFSNLKNKSNMPFAFNILKKIGIKIPPFFKTSHIFEKEVLELYKSGNTLNKDYYIEGWFGTENYFKKYKETIIKDLNICQFITDEYADSYKLVKESNSVSIHIRRGDYLSNGFFKVLPIDYYENAMLLITQRIKNPVFFFFSDDINWVKKKFSKIPNCKFVENNPIPESAYNNSSDLIDLALMSSCQHHIIANSTYSWWGAWLNTNTNKIIIAPSKWYNDPLAQKNYEKGNLIPNEWEKIYVK